MDGVVVSMFQNSKNVTITGGEIISVTGNYTKNIYINSDTPSERIPALPPLRRPSDFFTGRDTYLQTLQNHFSPNSSSGRKKFLLYGMGGIGKTQICLKFIEQCEKKWFSHIFWIDASSDETIDLCLRQIAQCYNGDPTPSAESALGWISCQSDWLMVFDNADGGYQVVEKFIPSGNEGNILITSRDKGLVRVTAGNLLEVTEMGKEEAIALLMKSATVHNSEDVAPVAEKLVEALGCIPLAIDQAGSYVLSCDCGLGYYLGLFEKHRAKLMSDKEFKGASLYKYSTYGTWEISMDEIKHRAESKLEDGGQTLAAQNALILHNTFAFLHHDNISEEIFEKAAMNFLERKNEDTLGLPQSISLLHTKTIFLDEDGNWDAFQFQAGIRLLMSFSLIRRNGDLYSVHPLIQTWSRDRIPKGRYVDYCQQARSLLACSLKVNYGDDDYKFWMLIAPHIKRNDEHVGQCISDETYYDDESERFALVFDRVGDWAKSEELQCKTVNERKMRLGESHPHTIDAIANLGITYSVKGREKEAEILKQNVMEARREMLGDDHPYTLTAMANLAVTYSNLGKETEAEVLKEKVVETRTKILGELHPDTLTAMANLAITYDNLGKEKEAASLKEKAVEARKIILGEFHPDTLTAMANLGVTYSIQGKEKEAEIVKEKVVEARKKILGELHPDTLSAMANLAVTYSRLGREKEAETLKKRVVEARKEVLGELHPDTLTAIANLAVTYGNQGKNKEAESLLEKTVEARKKVLGEFHPDTLTSMANLSVTYSILGKEKEAEIVKERVVEARKKILGEHHPNTLTAMANLAITYSNQGKNKEAVSLNKKVVKAREETLGEFHPDTLTAMANLAITYSNQGMEKEAESLQKKVVEARKKILGEHHPDTLTALANLTKMYQVQNKTDQSKALVDTSVHSLQQGSHGFRVEHPTPLSYQQNNVQGNSTNLPFKLGFSKFLDQVRSKISKSPRK